MSENMHFCQALGGRASGDNLLAEMFGDRVFDDQMISSSISPPLFENPAEICLEVIITLLIRKSCKLIKSRNFSEKLKFENDKRKLCKIENICRVFHRQCQTEDS